MARIGEVKPPVIVIDEKTLRTAYDAGPVCECEERYRALESLKFFIPGGTSPYVEKTFPEDLDVVWIRKGIEPGSLHFSKPVAIRKNNARGKHGQKTNPCDDLMFIKPPGQEKDEPFRMFSGI